jgi:hypothetical protein
LVATAKEEWFRELPRLCTCYRLLIAGFASTAKPLTRLTEQNMT